MNNKETQVMLEATCVIRDQREQLDWLQAQNKAMREALEKISEKCFGDCSRNASVEFMGDNAHEFCCKSERREYCVIFSARQALQPTPEKAFPRITYINQPYSNAWAVKAFIGPVPPCPVCNDSGEYDDESGVHGCQPCNSRCIPYIDYAGERHTLDWDETLERRDDGLHLVEPTPEVKP